MSARPHSSSLAASMRPLVSRSRRCTMPRRSSSPCTLHRLPAPQWWMSAFTSVPSSWSTDGWHTSPACFESTSRCSSSKRTSRSMGCPARGVRAGASSTSYTTVSPAATTCFFATVWPFTNTLSASTARAAALRLPYRPRSARSASMRRPASLAETIWQSERAISRAAPARRARRCRRFRRPPRPRRTPPPARTPFPTWRRASSRPHRA